MWGLGQAVSLAAYFLLSAAAGDQVLPPLVMAWAGLGTGAAVLAVAGWTGALRITASAADVELLHRHLSWIVPVLELALVSAVIAYVAGIAAARRLGARRPHAHRRHPDPRRRHQAVRANVKKVR
jgi:drug/metabolite transporter (DMT)-like permease